MIGLDTIPGSWVVMILLATGFGILGGPAYQLLQSYRGDAAGSGGRLGWIANPFVGSAGGSILSTMQARVVAQANEQKSQTAQQGVEATVAKKDLEIAQIKAATPDVVRGMVQEIVADRAQPKIEEQLEAVANEATSKMVDELKRAGVVDNQQARELVEKVRPTIDADKKSSSTYSGSQ